MFNKNPYLNNYPLEYTPEDNWNNNELYMIFRVCAVWGIHPKKSVQKYGFTLKFCPVYGYSLLNNYAFFIVKPSRKTLNKFGKPSRTLIILNKQRLNLRNLLLSRINYHRRSEFTEKISHRCWNILLSSSFIMFTHIF